MKKLTAAIAATAALVLGGAGVASAQETEVEPEVTVDNDMPVAGDEVEVTTTGLEPNAEATVTVGDQTITKVADADGVATGRIPVPAEPGEIDGIVTVNGVDYPFALVVQAAAAAGGDAGAGGGAAAGGDGTLPGTGLDDAGTLAALATALLAMGAMLVLLGRRSAATDS